MKRILFEMLNCQQKPLSEIKEGLTHQDIKRVWTVYDEDKIWSTYKFNPYTGKPIETLDDLVLSHLDGAVIEDYIHDWNIQYDSFHMYSRFYKKDSKIKVLIELK